MKPYISSFNSGRSLIELNAERENKRLLVILQNMEEEEEEEEEDVDASVEFSQFQAEDELMLDETVTAEQGAMLDRHK